MSTTRGRIHSIDHPTSHRASGCSHGSDTGKIYVPIAEGIVIERQLLQPATHAEDSAQLEQRAIAGCADVGFLQGKTSLVKADAFAEGFVTDWRNLLADTDRFLVLVFRRCSRVEGAENNKRAEQRHTKGKTPSMWR